MYLNVSTELDIEREWNTKMYDILSPAQKKLLQDEIYLKRAAEDFSDK